MMSRKFHVALLVLLAIATVAVAQRFRNRRGWGYEKPPADRGNVPQWDLDNGFAHDVFTFVRIEYDPGGRLRSWLGGGGVWYIDYPDAELNLSFRLQQLTSMKVHPEPEHKHIRLTNPALFDYPFIYIVEPGDLMFTEEEVPLLRRYLLSGGFLMVDDFWGEAEWQNFYEEIKRVFPEREPVELDLEHPIFNCVFPIREKLQIPNVRDGTLYGPEGITWERPDAKEVHYKAIFDDKGRMMVMICHNTDLGDGWEWEGSNEYYFREFSEKRAYPLGINIIFYAMTH